MKICICLDGGGCRGVIEIASLMWLSENFDIGSNDVSLVVGTSTGAVVGTLYRSGVKLDEMMELYLDDMPHIFKLDWTSLFGLLGPKYKTSPIDDTFKKWMRNNILKFAKFNEYRMLMISSYNLSTKQETFFKSWNKEIKGTHVVPKFRMNRINIHDALRAATSIPTYWPPVVINGYYYCDGGVVANCPLLAAYTEMRSLFPKEKIIILSLGTGHAAIEHKTPHYRKFGIFQWIEPLLNIFTNNNYDNYIANNITRTVDDKCAVIRINPFISSGKFKSILSRDDMEELATHATRSLKSNATIHQKLEVLLHD